MHYWKINFFRLLIDFKIIMNNPDANIFFGSRESKRFSRVWTNWETQNRFWKRIIVLDSFYASFSLLCDLNYLPYSDERTVTVEKKVHQKPHLQICLIGDYAIPYNNEIRNDIVINVPVVITSIISMSKRSSVHIMNKIC